MEPAESVQVNIYQSNTYRKDLSRLYFSNEPRVQDRQQVKKHQSYILVFVAYLTIPSRGTSPDIKKVFHAWLYGRFIEIHKLHRTNQVLNLLAGSFSNRDNVRVPNLI